MKPDPHGQPAATTWKVLGRATLAALVERALSARACHECSLPRLRGRAGRGQTREAGRKLTPLPTPPPQGEREQTEQAGREVSQLRFDGRDATHLARARAADRPHASTARALRRHGLADPRRYDLRHGAAHAAGPACICIRARSWCRSTRTVRRSRCRRRCRCTCTRRCRPAAGRARCSGWWIEAKRAR